jgi:Xaa-Pro aminopeptidase
MITMENVLKRGRTAWDRDLLPEDEYIERTFAVRDAMEAAGLDVIVSIGHSTHTGNFTYLSGSVPPLGWMSVVLGRETGPFLVSGGGSREVPFVRTQTWIEDIRTSKSLFAGPAAVVTEVLAEIASPGAKVGLVGATEDLSPSAYAEMLAALSVYEVVEVDNLVADVRAVKRPREVVALEESLEIARAAVAAAVEAWEGGASNADALIAAEGTARLRGARDVRVLGNLEGEELAPVEEHSDVHHDRLVIHCAVEYIGYWSQANAEVGAGATTSGAARRAVDAMVAAATPGATAAELVAAAQAELPEGAQDVAVSYGFGGGLGLDSTELPRLVPGGTDVLVDGGIIGVQVFTRESGRLTCAGETIRIDATGATVL